MPITSFLLMICKYWISKFLIRQKITAVSNCVKPYRLYKIDTLTHTQQHAHVYTFTQSHTVMHIHIHTWHNHMHAQTCTHTNTPIYTCFQFISSIQCLFITVSLYILGKHIMINKCWFWHDLILTLVFSLWINPDSSMVLQITLL